MKNEINELLKFKTEELAFVELMKDKEYDFNGAKLKAGIPIPINVSAISKSIENTDGNFLIEDIIDGMINIIGIDNNFQYNSYYIDFLKKYNSKIIFFILNKGFECINQDKLFDSLVYFRGAVEIDPDNLDACFNYGRSLEDLASENLVKENQKKYEIFMEEAFEVFLRLKTNHPKFHLSYYHLGFHYVNRKDYNDAKDVWTKVLKMEIDDDIKEETIKNLRDLEGRIMFEKGYKLILQGRSNEGLETLLSIKDDYPDWWNLMFFIGLGYRQIENFEQAYEYFVEALTLNTGNVDTMNEIGICLMSLGEFDKSEKYFKEALKIDINNSEILCNLGIVYISTGNIGLAEKYINKSFEINPDDEVTNSWMDYLKKLQNKLNN